MHTKKRHISWHDEKPKFKTYRYWKPKICQNGHKFWFQAYTTIKYNPRHPELRTKPICHTSPDRTPIFSSPRCQHQHFCRTPPDRIRIPPPSLPTATHYKMCSQKQFLYNTDQYNQRNWTNMGPNTRQEAILDIERDNLTHSKDWANILRKCLRRNSKRCLTTFSLENKPLYLSSNGCALGQSALREMVNNSHHGEPSMTSITDFSKNLEFFLTCKMTFCWKSRNLWTRYDIFTNSGSNT